jgi:hypothetical protein
MRSWAELPSDERAVFADNLAAVHYAANQKPRWPRVPKVKAAPKPPSRTAPQTSTLNGDAATSPQPAPARGSAEAFALVLRAWAELPADERAAFAADLADIHEAVNQKPCWPSSRRAVRKPRRKLDAATVRNRV